MDKTIEDNLETDSDVGAQNANNERSKNKQRNSLKIFKSTEIKDCSRENKTPIQNAPENLREIVSKKSSLKQQRRNKIVNNVESTADKRNTMETIFEDPDEQTREITNMTMDIKNIKDGIKLMAMKPSRFDKSQAKNSLPDIEI